MRTRQRVRYRKLNRIGGQEFFFSFFFLNFSKRATEFRFRTGTRVVTGNALKKAGSVRGLHKRCIAAKWDSHSEVGKKEHGRTKE